MATDLKILTLNVNGMKDRCKRAQVLDFCRTNGADVACLQECHVSTVADKKQWSRQWGQTCVWSMGTNSARGVGILLSSRWSLRASNVDTEGRVASVLVSDGLSTYNIVNVYAPCSAGERQAFFATIHQYMFPNATLVLAGDFNCVLDPARDRSSASATTAGSGTQDVRELRSLIDDLEVIDAWRVEHPSEIEYTWRSPSNSTRSRLDRIYVPDGLDFRSVIVPCTFSDHDAVAVSTKPPVTVRKGQGIWKCNTTVLSDPVFAVKFKAQYPGWQKQKGEHQSLRDWWDHMKQQAKDLLIECSREKARTLAALQRHRKIRVDQLRSRLNSGDTSSQTLKDYEEAREEVNKYIQDKLAGQRLRSKITQVEQDEKPTRSFFRAEKKRGEKKSIPSIRKPDGTVTTASDEILGVFQDFYKELYSPDQLNQTDQDHFLNGLSASLEGDSVARLERPLSLMELEEAVKGMENNKSPGSDGLPKEFYLQFWALLGQDLLDVLNEGVQAEKKGDPLNPANRRPISLLNVDYKILSKALANRLKSVAQEVVHSNQSCGIPGRSIEDSVTLLRDITEYVNSKNLPCVFLALDQEKAFDRVDHEYMGRVLNRLGFGPSFQRWIQVLYTNVSSKVLVNGFVSDAVSVGRGVRQGCPLSPLLYVLCLEPLAAAIRADPDIRGVQIPGSGGQETKLVQYADDNTCILSDDWSISKTFDTIKKFEAATGSKLNFGKTEALWLGCWRGRRDKPHPISGWTSSHLKLFGTPIGSALLAEQAWMLRFAKFREKLAQWRERKLTLFGKALIINSLAAATLWYVAPVYPLPDSVKVRIEKEMFQFVWDGKTEMVNRRTLMLPKEKGGLGLVSIPIKAKALMLKCIHKALVQPHLPTSRYVHYWLGLSLRRIDPESWSNTAPHSPDRPPHYDKVFQYLKDISDRGVVIDWNTCSTMSLYSALLEAENTTPRCVLVDPRIDWQSVWKAVHNPVVEKWDRILSWLTVHDGLKTRQKLKSWRGYIANDKCPRRGCSMVESLLHLFWECTVSSEVWGWVEGLIHRRILHGYGLPRDLALRGIVSQPMPKRTRQVLEALAAITRSLIWRSRCQDAFERTNFTGQDLISKLERVLTDKLHFEFERLGPSRFIDTWAEGHSWAVVDIAHCTLKDTWRVEHPTLLEYTWRSPSNNTRSRLDRIYPSDDLSTAAKIVSCPFSDHDANVTSVVPAHPVQQGRGVWKCNVKTLSDCLFVNELEEQYKGWKDQKSDHPSLRDWWDTVKVLIKDLVVKHSKRRAKEAKLIQKSLEKNLDLLRSRLNAGDRTPSALKEYEQAKEKVNKLVQDRSEREKGKKRLIKEIRDQNGDTVSTTDEVTDVFRDFYTRLFTKDQLNLEDREFFLDKLDTALPEEVSNCLERPLSSEELLSAIKGMANNKTPGSDGLPKEFYYKFWDLVGLDILEVFNEGLGDGLLAVSQRQGIITLLDKAWDPLDPANKRPISLLNVDYKILAKALANRLKRVISQVVNADQSCGIPGRSITDSVCLHRDIAAYANDKDLPCVFLALDQEKAFDRVDHEFMVSILEKLGFGPVFRSWNATLYNGASSNVLVNGNLSSSIPCERGVRQGCPLSPLLYVLCIEPLAAAIRVDPHIKGVHLPGGAGKETKIVQYADDNTIVLSDDESIVRTFHLISKFESGTGSKLNMQKTEALWLGSWRGRSDKPFPIKRWDSTYLKVLGTPVGNIPLAEEAWLQRFTNFKARLDQWRGRKLTLMGKSLIVNSLASATLWYTAPVYPLPANVRSRIEKEMFNFMWDGKTELVKRQTLLLPKDQGGVGLVSVPLKAKALMLKTLKKVFTDPQHPCSCFSKYWLGLELRRIDSQTWSNSAPHSMDRPSHYVAIAQYLRDITVPVDWTACTTASLYNTLLEQASSPPRCIQSNPQIQWDKVWKVIHNPLIFKWDRMIAWHTAHNSLKTKLKLNSWRGYLASSACPRRGCSQPESVAHLFWECAVVAEVWMWMEAFIHKHLHRHFHVSKTFALWGLVPQGVPAQTRKVLEVLSCMAKSSIWRSRCQSVFESKHLTGAEVSKSLASSMRDRLNLELNCFEPIKTGVRQYKIEIKTHLPNSMRIGNNTVSFHYHGQPRICHKCGSPDHFVADCQAKKCFRCHELGHLAADCKRQYKEKSLVAAISDEEGEDEREEDLESVDYASSDEEESIFRPHKDSSDVEESTPIVSKSEKAVGARPKATVSAPTADPKPAQGKESPKPAQAKESGMEIEVAQGGGELADSQTDMFKGSAEEPASTGSLILAGLPEDGANKLPDSGKLTEPGTSLGLELPLSENLVIDQFTSTSSGEESNSGKRTKGRNSRTSRKKVDVACLQECHVSNLADRSSGQNSGGGVGVWSLGTNSAKGVGTLLSPRWSLRGSKVDTEGRVSICRDKIVTWSAVHDALKTRQKLFSWRRLIANSECPRRGCQRVETVAYLFSECAVVEEMWLWVEHLIHRRVLPGFHLSPEFSLRGVVPQGAPKKTRLVLEALSVLIRAFVWRTRCAVVFEKANYSGSDMIEGVRKVIADKLTFEFARLGPAGFYSTCADGHSWANVAVAHLDTKCLVTGPPDTVQVTVRGTDLEQVNEFSYLGSLQTADCSSSREVKIRIAKSTSVLGKLKHIWASSNISTKTKIYLLRSLVLSIFLYGAEAWTLNAEITKRINAFEMNCYRILLQIHWSTHTTNEEVKHRVKSLAGPLPSFLSLVKKRKLQWFGHVTRAKGTLAHTTLQGKAEGGRMRGRPRRTWTSDLKEWTGHPLSHLTSLAENRPGWITLVDS
ncbi:hypothetical protein Bbelb_011280 [Branchiostoma belcheri]|nr:hypothetical protein Bbelb_011280 [Branchiostoma belcheri]